MSNYDDRIRDLLERTRPSLTVREGCEIRHNVWTKVTKTRFAPRLYYSFGAAVLGLIIFLAVILTPESKPEGIWNISFYTDKELLEEVSQLPQEQVVAGLLGEDGEDIASAIYSDVDIEDAITSLTHEEQEELILALAEL